MMIIQGNLQTLTVICAGTKRGCMHMSEGHKGILATVIRAVLAFGSEY